MHLSFYSQRAMVYPNEVELNVIAGSCTSCGSLVHRSTAMRIEGQTALFCSQMCVERFQTQVFR